MSCIPGLSLYSVDTDEAVTIPASEENTFPMPESQMLGSCRPVGDFEKLSTIADGKFGTIYKVKETKSENIFALKKFKMLDDDSDDDTDGFPTWILREINILYSLKHENVIGRHGQLAGKSIKENYLLLDYCVMSLEDLFERNIQAIYHRAVVKCIAKQLFKGLEYIHSSLIIHRDINCHNIMFNENGVLKITGFRAARFYTTGAMTPDLTELPYRAPELLLRSRYYYPSVDLWSCGCVFAKLVLRKPLFAGNSELEVFASIVKLLGAPSEEIWPGFTVLFENFDDIKREIDAPKRCELREMFSLHSQSIQDLVFGFIRYDPKIRMTLVEALHKKPYFSEIPLACSLPHLASIICASR